MQIKLGIVGMPLLLMCTALSFGAPSVQLKSLSQDSRFLYPAGRWSFNLGVNVFRTSDKTNTFPRFELESLLTPSLTGSVFGEFLAKKMSDGGDSVPTAFALGMGVHYYSKRFFRGFVVELSGREKLTKQLGERYAQAFSLVPMLGWRWRNEEHHASFSTKVGFEKVFASNSELNPAVNLALGVDFNPEEVFN